MLTMATASSATSILNSDGPKAIMYDLICNSGDNSTIILIKLNYLICLTP